MKKYGFLLIVSLISSVAFLNCADTIETADSLICSSDSTLIQSVGCCFISYQWNNGETSDHIFAKTAGEYWVTAIDVNNCTAVSNHINIYTYPVPSISIEQHDDTLFCFGGRVYLWYFNNNFIPDAVNQSYIITQAGNYSVGVYDTIYGCFIMSSSQYFSPNYGVALASGNICSGSFITLNPKVNLDLPPFSYSWSSTGSPLNCYSCNYPCAQVKQNSSYTLTVTDATNQSVTATANYTVTGNGTIPEVFITNSNLSCSESIDTTIVYITNSTARCTFDWGDGTNQSPDSLLSLHNYSSAGYFVITVTDSFGCTNSMLDSVINNGIVISYPKIIYPKCSSNTGEIIATATGGAPPYSYRWNTGNLSDSLIGILSAVYSLTVTDINTCSGHSAVNLNNLDWNYFVFLNPTYPNCHTNGSIASQINSGYSPFSYKWSNGDTIPVITGLSSTLYSLTVTDSLGCNFSANTSLYANCYSVISGTAFIDLNSDCKMDSGDLPASDIIVSATLGNDYFYGYTDVNGRYSINVVGLGDFTLNSYDYYNNLCAQLVFCDGALTTITNQGDSSINNDIGVSASSDFDIGLHPGWSSASPGFIKKYWTFYYNNSAISYLGSATITFTYDSNLVYQSSLAPFPTYTPGSHTLTWQVNNIEGNTFYWDNQLISYFLVPSTLDPTYALQSTFSINPTLGDCDITDNYFHFSELSTGSHDPNGKTVSPTGLITEDDSVLTYTIYFQNDGTDSTYFIVVKDTLPSTLDPVTVRNIASSHQYSSFNISGSGILTWTFNPLRLVDSMTDPNGSKGFIIFTVKKRTNQPIGNIISNGAVIYFDYNQPVSTNLAIDTTSVQASVNSLSINSKPAINIYPNPSIGVLNVIPTGFVPKWITIFDIQGRKVNEELYKQQINIGNLCSGVYFIEVRDEFVAMRKMFAMQ